MCESFNMVCYGLFHTETIESLWDENIIKNYLDGWICYSLFIREVVRNNLSWPQRINLLCDYLKIN